MYPFQQMGSKPGGIDASLPFISKNDRSGSHNQTMNSLLSFHQNMMAPNPSPQANQPWQYIDTGSDSKATGDLQKEFKGLETLNMPVDSVLTEGHGFGNPSPALSVMLDAADQQ